MDDVNQMFGCPIKKVSGKKINYTYTQALLQDRQPCTFVLGWAYQDMELSKWLHIAPQCSRNATWIEQTHDFIQYVLPIDIPSKFNPNAEIVPVVANTDPLHVASEFYANPKTGASEMSTVRCNILRSATMMLRFFGIKSTPQENTFSLSIAEPTVFMKEGPFQTWNVDNAFVKNLRHAKHNDLRMTRLVRCLRLFGFHQMAFQALQLLSSLLHVIGRSKHLLQMDNKSYMANEYLAKEFVLLSNLFNIAKAFNDEDLFADDLEGIENADLQSVCEFVTLLDEMKF